MVSRFMFIDRSMMSCRPNMRGSPSHACTCGREEQSRGAGQALGWSAGTLELRHHSVTVLSLLSHACMQRDWSLCFCLTAAGLPPAIPHSSDLLQHACLFTGACAGAQLVELYTDALCALLDISCVVGASSTFSPQNEPLDSQSRNKNPDNQSQGTQRRPQVGKTLIDQLKPQPVTRTGRLVCCQVKCGHKTTCVSPQHACISSEHVQDSESRTPQRQALKHASALPFTSTNCQQVDTAVVCRHAGASTSLHQTCCSHNSTWHAHVAPTTGRMQQLPSLPDCTHGLCAVHTVHPQHSSSDGTTPHVFALHTKKEKKSGYHSDKNQITCEAAPGCTCCDLPFR